MCTTKSHVATLATALTPARMYTKPVTRHQTPVTMTRISRKDLPQQEAEHEARVFAIAVVRLAGGGCLSPHAEGAKRHHKHGQVGAAGGKLQQQVGHVTSGQAGCEDPVHHGYDSIYCQARLLMMACA